MTEIPEPAQPQEPKKEGVNPFARLFGVLFSPIETLRNIAARPDWVVPFLVIIIASVGMNILVAPHVDLEPQLRAQYEKQGMGEEDIQNALDMVEKFGKFQAVITAVFIPIMILAIAGIFLLVVKVFGGEGSFKQVFSVTNYGWIPQLLKGIIFTAIILPKGMIDARDLPLLLKSNLGFLGDPVDAPMAFAFLSSLDVFVFWTLFLFVVGLSQVSGFSKTKTAWMVVPLWLVVVLVKVGFAALQGAG